MHVLFLICHVVALFRIPRCHKSLKPRTSYALLFLQYLSAVLYALFMGWSQNYLVPEESLNRIALRFYLGFVYIPMFDQLVLMTAMMFVILGIMFVE